MNTQMLIDGKLLDGGRRLTVVDPATGQALTECACATEQDVDRAVAAAQAAFPAWAATPIANRHEVMAAMAAKVEQHADSLARLLTQEQGKPLTEAQMEVGIAAMFLNHFAQVELPNETVELPGGGKAVIERRPLGVVAAIVPWNFPVLTAIGKVGAALVTGNTVILKPAATTPLTALYLGALFKEIVPAGVLNVVTDANDLGELFSRHPGIRKISFTGSTATGAKIMSAAAPTLKRLTLELGGNDAAIILPDSDPDVVAPQIFGSTFWNNGQVCVAVKRLYVHASQYDAYCTRLAALAGSAIVGDGLEQGTQFGPLQNRAHYDKVRATIEQAREQGRIIAGGTYPDRAGYFIDPTIVCDIPDTASLVEDEQFGPVLPILSYDSIDDAVARANQTPYGLGNSIWSPNVAAARRIADRLDSGTVWINQHGAIATNVPFAGAKTSGIGSEYGVDGLLELTQLKVINTAA